MAVRWNTGGTTVPAAAQASEPPIPGARRVPPANAQEIDGPNVARRQPRRTFGAFATLMCVRTPRGVVPRIVPAARSPSQFPERFKFVCRLTLNYRNVVPTPIASTGSSVYLR